MSGLTIRPNKDTGKLELTAESNENVNRSRVIDNFEKTIQTAQYHNIATKWITLGLILSFTTAFVVIAINLENIGFIMALILFTLIAFASYIIVNYIDHMNTKYIMDAVSRMVNIFATKEKDSPQENDEKKKIY